MAQAARVLDTPRLRLRPFTQADAPAYAEMCADAEVMRHIGIGEVQSASEAWRTVAYFLGHWQLRGYGMWALEHRDSGALLGRVISLIRPGNRRSIAVAEAIGETLHDKLELMGGETLVYAVRR